MGGTWQDLTKIKLHGLRWQEVRSKKKEVPNLLEMKKARRWASLRAVATGGKGDG